MTLENRIGDIKGKNVLLLQGPMGTFFNKLTKICIKKGANPFRIGFNAGDQFFALKHNFYPYKGTPKQWPKFIKKFYSEHNIELVFLFGDCRFYHKMAIQIAKNMQIDVYVFEEGYLRPGFITMEYFGANHHSKTPRYREYYDTYTPRFKQDYIEQTTYSTYGRMAWWALEYYMISNIFYFLYPHYIHHRDFSAFKEGVYGIINFLRKMKHKITERNLEIIFEKNLCKKYYFVPIQTHDDFQVRAHSRFRTMESFIEYNIASFSKNAPKDTFLVFKHHPMDRGKRNYTAYIKYLAKIYKAEKRIYAVFDVHLPTIIRHSRAVVLINSTVGLSALYHNKPTFCLGNAIYDIEGLTTKGISLDKFWTKHRTVDSKLYVKFRRYLLDHTQIPGSFYLGGDKIVF